MPEVKFNVEGMSCGGCARSVERKLLNTMGVKSAVVDLAAAQADVQYEEGVVDPARLTAAIESLGFKVV